MPSEKLSFPNGRGETLDGRLELPEGEVRGTALFAHCFTCSKNVKAASTISRGLAQAGVAVLRFDFTGLGSSEGDFANERFSSNVEDLVRASAALGERLSPPSLLVGHSLGGAAVLMAAPQLPSVKAVATVGAPADTAHLKHLFKDSLPLIDEQGRAEVTLGGRTFTITQGFVEDLDTHPLSETVGMLNRAILVFHAPLDQTVGLDNARLIYNAAKHPKSFLSLPGADHLLSDAADARYLAEVLGAWVGRYL